MEGPAPIQMEFVMRKALICLSFAGALAAHSILAAPVADKAVVGNSRFWGKITAVDPAQKTLTVFNRKRQETAKFSWSPETEFTNDKNPMQPNDLAIGQFLMVAYQGEGDKRVAAEVAVRSTPFKKKVTP